MKYMNCDRKCKQKNYIVRCLAMVASEWSNFAHIRRLRHFTARAIIIISDNENTTFPGFVSCTLMDTLRYAGMLGGCPPGGGGIS